MTIEKTDSITHLVKIVAAEVLDDKLKEHSVATSEEISKIVGTIDSRLRRVEQELGLSVPTIAAPKEWVAYRAGRSWEFEEEEALTEDFNTAIKWMASRRGRTEGSIYARVRKLAKDGCL